MTTARKALTAERLRELLSYDETTGEFCWLADRVKGWNHNVIAAKAGDVAGWLDIATGRWRITIDGRRYLRARLARLFLHRMWPKNFVDHINCDSQDDRTANLLGATHLQNLAIPPGGCPKVVAVCAQDRADAAILLPL